MDFLDHIYLANGTPRQKDAWRVMNELAIFDTLAQYSPVLAGTIPLDIDIPGSDLDILCYYLNYQEFYKFLTEHFAKHTHFSCRYSNLRQAVIGSFVVNGFEVEIFGQSIPVVQQAGYRHMLIEHQILQQQGNSFKEEIIALKKQGIKTEPAFAQLLGLTGDPYQAVLNYKI